MQDRPMVYLTTVTGTFHARVVAARLGADGILTELRGDVGGIYPLGGRVEVFVESDAASDARKILAADEADAVLARLDEAPTGETGRRRGLHRVWLIIAWLLIAVLIALYLMATFG